MSTVTSKDGSKVAYEKSGSGPALVIVSAMPDRSANGPLVELLARHFTVYNYDRRCDMAELFLTAAVSLPVEFVKPMRDFPGWSAFEASAPALIHDAEVIGDFSIPGTLKNVTTPTLVLDGGTTTWLTTGSDELVKVLPNATRQTLAGQQHNVEATAIAAALEKFFLG
jgi:hypothetical protein